MWLFETQLAQQGVQNIAGIDEAGRGPLAGPVVSAAVILGPGFDCPGIDDSKKLSEKKRDKLYPRILDQAVSVGIGICDHLKIDEINILRASLLSMKKAVDDLAVRPGFLLIDGKFTLDLPCDTETGQQAIVRGDSRSISIAAASIVAKVTRDRIMRELDTQFPAYGFGRHKGYPTKAHKKAIVDHGPSPFHRMTFKGVKSP